MAAAAAAAPKRKKKKGMERRPCDACGKSDVQVSNCAKCRQAAYCSVACQKAAWPTHKAVCVAPKDDPKVKRLTGHAEGVPPAAAAAAADIVEPIPFPDGWVEGGRICPVCRDPMDPRDTHTDFVCPVCLGEVCYACLSKLAEEL